MDATNCFILEPLADHTAQRRSSAGFIIHAKGDAVVIAEVVFAEIAVQVLFLAVLIDALHAALKVDEATGYQYARTKNALSRILEAFVAKELQPWVKTFPNDYYQEMFRLRDLEYSPDSVKRPQYIGKLTNDIVYDRLAPGVRHELKKAMPKRENGRPKGTLAQMLTRNVGYPKLREHLGAVVATMRMSDDWHDFKRKLDKFYPRYGDLPLFDYALEDDGRGL